MKNSKKEKYLGDFIDESGKIKATIEDRVSKGWGIISEIKAILNEVPLGKFKVEIGLLLRQAMLVNGVLYNSEVWHSLSPNDIIPLEKIDETLLRFILDAHPKAPLETLYLETGAIPIRYVIASRRMNYLQTILRRDENELTRKVFMAQIKNPSEGDYAELVKSNFKETNFAFNLKDIESTGVQSYKRIIKNNIKEAALKYLKSKQEKHIKVKHLKYEKLESQSYLTSHIFMNNETSLLYALRTKTARTFKANSSNLYNGKIECPLKCWDLSFNEPEPPDTQEHALVCKKMKFFANSIARNKMEYEDLFVDTNKQKEVVSYYSTIIEKRENILKDEQNPPGDKLDPSGSSSNRCNSTLFTYSTDGTIIGNK